MQLKSNFNYFTFVTAVALSLIGCASDVKLESVDPVAASNASIRAYRGIETAHRALPTLNTNVTQKAHYDHVYVDSKDPDAGSLKTIELKDAIANDVLASNPLHVTRQVLDPSKLHWMTFGSGDVRPTGLEGVGGFGVGDNNYVEVNFDVDKTIVINSEKLDPLITKSFRVSGIFYVVGFADETGIESKNQSLSINRALAAKSILIEANIHPSRIFDSGAGVSRTYSDLALNRRASITFKPDMLKQ